jgi:hypothetical protein
MILILQHQPSKIIGRSCWIKTVTILPFCYSGKKVGESSTFPIVIGRKNEDHEPVEKRFCEERRSCNSLMLGARRYSSRWSYTGDIGSVAQHLPSCIVCEQANNQFLVTDNNCRRCTNWETCGDHPLLRTPIPKNYPSEAF